jgi:hypothetical protein
MLRLRVQLLIGFFAACNGYFLKTDAVTIKAINERKRVLIGLEIVIAISQSSS